MISRRSMLIAPLAAGVAARSGFGASGRMTLGMHQTSSLNAGYRKSLEGWARAGIKHVEIGGASLDEFLKTDTLVAARRLLTDLGLTAASCGAGVLGVWDSNPNRAAALDTLKRRCEQFSSFGVDRMVCPTTTTQKITEDHYKSGVDNIREVGEIAKQYRMIAMMEFVRATPFIGTLSTALQMTRAAAHPNARPMIDCYHFWAGLSKFEDLDLIRPGEIAHVHFQDTEKISRELLDNTTRVIPGDGTAPLARILKKLSEKGYTGTLAVELFKPQFQSADPYELARQVREKSEPILRDAKVL